MYDFIILVINDFLMGPNLRPLTILIVGIGLLGGLIYAIGGGSGSDD